MKALAVTLAVVLASLAIPSRAAATSPIQPANLSVTAVAASGPTCNWAYWSWKHGLIPARKPNNTYCSLRKGNYNNIAVVALQNALVKCYGQTIAIDADFGPATKRALIKAQAWEQHVNHKTRLAANGVYNHDTLVAMRWPYYKDPNKLNGPFRCSY
jgi:hypothetical protein